MPNRELKKESVVNNEKKTIKSVLSFQKYKPLFITPIDLRL